MHGNILAGAAVHLLTASGAVCGLMALRYAVAQDWTLSFLWLGAAAFVDAVDGPIARKVQVEHALPRFSGARIDLVVDYFNYCAVPAFIVMESGRAGDGFGALAGGLILLTSLFHFADLKAKTEDGFFVGFPALWNVVCLYFFVYDLEPAAVRTIILVLAAATFIPLKWVHPLRARRWRGITLAVTFVWSVAALYEVILGFPETAWVRVVFAVAAAYFLAVGFSRTFQAGK